MFLLFAQILSLFWYAAMRPLFVFVYYIAEEKRDEIIIIERT